MKILLISHGESTYPDGLASIYYYLKKMKYDVDFIDLNNREINSYLHKPDFVGITSMTKEFYNTCKLSKIVKSKWPNCKLIVGGRHFNSDTLSLSFDQKIQYADHIVVGEGEYAMVDIIEGNVTDYIIKGKPLSKEDYNNLPFPDKDFIIKNMSRSICGYGKDARVLFTRGCPFKCVFCESETGRKPVISKNPDKCVSYIKDMEKWFNIKRIFIYDDIFAVNKKWLKDFKDEWIKQKPASELKCFIHGKLFNEEILEILNQINVKTVCLGAESGDDSVLKAIKKGATVDNYLNIHNMIRSKSKNIRLECLWMLGNITETNKTIENTVKLSKQIGDKHPSWFSFAIPFPGTSFWKDADKYGKIIEKDFSKWGNRTIVFLPNGVSKEDMQRWYDISQS